MTWSSTKTVDLTAAKMEDDDSTSLSSFISVGTAEVRPMSRAKSPEDNLDVRTAKQTTTTPTLTLAELIEMHRLPPVPPPQPSPPSQDTMHRLRRGCEETENRRSIIAPSSVKINFIGSLSDTPIALPLEKGLQKLYRLYQDNDPAPCLLPRDVQITEIPLTTIAESLESHIIEIKTALDDCATNIENLNQVNQQTRDEMFNLEFQYCLARQEANMCSMSADDFRLRLEWQKEEIARVNAEKEAALAANLAYAKDQIRLRREMLGLLEIRNENIKLKQMNRMHEQRYHDMQDQLEEARKCLDRTHFALKTVPGPLQRLCAKVLVPQPHGERTCELRGGDGDEDKEEEIEPPGISAKERRRHSVPLQSRAQTPSRQYY